MMLQMYINNLLIDQVPILFYPDYTMKEKIGIVNDEKKTLMHDHLNKAFVSYVKPVFILTAESKANKLIAEDIDNKLIIELEQQLKKIRKACK